MSCRHCRYWEMGDEGAYNKWNIERGRCNRYPKSITTSRKHVCGEFSAENPGDIDSFLAVRNMYYERGKEERKKRIDAMRKLKIRNQQIRELREKLKRMQDGER